MIIYSTLCMTLYVCHLFFQKLSMMIVHCTVDLSVHVTKSKSHVLFWAVFEGSGRQLIVHGLIRTDSRLEIFVFVWNPGKIPKVRRYSNMYRNWMLGLYVIWWFISAFDCLYSTIKRFYLLFLNKKDISGIAIYPWRILIIVEIRFCFLAFKKTV